MLHKLFLKINFLALKLQKMKTFLFNCEHRYENCTFRCSKPAKWKILRRLELRLLDSKSKVITGYTIESIVGIWSPWSKSHRNPILNSSLSPSNRTLSSIPSSVLLYEEPSNEFSISTRPLKPGLHKLKKSVVI